MVNLNGKVALITGASSGIGAATAIHFASLGCAVAINGRNVTKLNNTLSECIAAGLSEKDVLVVVGDVSLEQDAITIVENTIAHFGKLDILVNNAGIFSTGGNLETESLDTFDKIINTNLRAVFHLIKLCAPHLKKTKGNIVNVSSVAANITRPNVHSYKMSKAGLDHLTRTAARELGKYQVRVNGVNPGMILTDIFNKIGLPKNAVDKMFENGKKHHAIGRIGQPIEIAKPIAFLASNEASFVTGTNFLVDGGYSLMDNHNTAQ